MVARDALFDLAVERALSYTQSLNIASQNKEELHKRLEVWYLKTRFAYRIPLDDMLKVLQTYPGTGVWTGGKNGTWQNLSEP
jgi:hypothetical protein